MRKITFILSLFFTLGLSAQMNMRDVLKTIPDSIIPYLTENNKLDMIDFADSKMDAIVTNLLGGKSQLLKLTGQYASIRLNESTEITLRLLDMSEPVDSIMQIVCVVRTIGTDLRESTIDFFSLHWRRLPLDKFLSSTTGMMIATLGESEPTLMLLPECRLDAPANEEQEEITKSSIILKWNNRFVNVY